eukprot:6214650-Pleurochrysis_carterae.AAC.1
MVRLIIGGGVVCPLRLWGLRFLDGASAVASLSPYYHAPAIYCRASPVELQLAVATTTVVRI